MNRKVVPLRPNAPDGDEARPRAIPRVISHPPGMGRDTLIDACKKQEQLILSYEARLTAMAEREMPGPLDFGRLRRPQDHP